MNTLQALGVAMAILTFAVGILIIVDNRKALREEKALRRDLRDLQRHADSLGPNPTDEQLAELDERTADFGRRLAEWERSPFVRRRPQ